MAVSKLKLIITICIFLILTITKCGLAQENAQTRIPASLEECYNQPELLQRDNRLPMTIQTLIELIRKVEDSGTQQDMRQLAISLVHRFRLDGIERDHRVLNAPGVLPFSPLGHQFAKHRLLLSRLVPGNAINFPNNTLTALERCTLHFMMSSSFELRIRGDEATRCNQLAQFRVERVPRDAADFDTEAEPTADEDEEVQNAEGNEDAPLEEGFHEEIESINNQVDIATNSISQCPVENGVVRTQWGAIAVGPLITGIAAGLEPQTVTTRELLALSSGGGIVGQQNQNFNVDNRWASTLTGDLAEVTLHQGPIAQTMTVGAPGAWNSTAVPRWYFLSQRESLEMTDAEIRGGLDGLILAQNILQWRQQVSTLRLSQVLEMYYSQRGVFGTNIRACNRNELFTTVAPMAQLQDQTAAFSIVLEKESRTPATISQASIVQFANAASSRLQAYMPTLHIPSCSVAAAQAGVADNIQRLVAADIFIYVDASWTFAQINPVVTAILDGLNVNRFGSRYTLLGANDTMVFVNRTHFVNDMHSTWLVTNHTAIQPGFHLPTVVRSIREQSQALMDEERTSNIAGGRSKIAIVIPNAGQVNEADTSFSQQQITILREIVPDIRILFVAGGTATRFNPFVQDETRDIFTLAANPAPQALVTAQQVITRVQQIPRRIVNPRCGSNWQSTERGNNQFVGHVRAGGIIFYRLASNYFFRNSDGAQRVRIAGQGFGTITVCQSRTVENPRSNSTNPGDVNCRQILSDQFDADLNNACEGHDFINQCPPLFLSLQGAEIQGNNFRCADNNCQFVDDLRFTLTVENLECFSGAKTITASILTLAMAVYYVLRNFM